MTMNNVIPISAALRCIIPNCGRRIEPHDDPDPIRLCSEHQLPIDQIARLKLLPGQTWRMMIEQRAILHFHDRPIERRRSQRMLSLVWSFPCLQRCPLTSWDAKKFASWAWEKCHSSGELHAARFILNVWNPKTHWRLGKFDMMRALGTWNANNRRGFLEWARDPWWP